MGREPPSDVPSPLGSSTFLTSLAFTPDARAFLIYGICHHGLLRSALKDAKMWGAEGLLHLNMRITARRKHDTLLIRFPG